MTCHFFSQPLAAAQVMAQRFLGKKADALADMRQRGAARVHTGTTNTANVMTIAAALDFHEQVGIASKAARLRYLRDYWVSRVRGQAGLEILTPDEAGMTGAITAFRLSGQTSKGADQAVAARLLQQYGICTVQRGGWPRAIACG
jgi:selenocysteine lyase/cysteine desulfurase